MNRTLVRFVLATAPIASSAAVRAAIAAEGGGPGRRPDSASEKLGRLDREVGELLERLGGAKVAPVAVLPVGEHPTRVFEGDPSRLPGIQRALERPLDLPRRGLELLESVRKKGGEARVVEAACRLAGIELSGASPAAPPRLEDLWFGLGVKESVPVEWNSLAPTARDALRRVFAALLDAVRARKEVFDAYGPAEMAAIRGPGLAIGTPRSRLAPESVVSFAGVHLQRGGSTRLASAARDLLSAAVSGLAGLRSPAVARVASARARRFETPHGAIVVGTPRRDEHLEPALFVLDPGGDDRYGPRAGSSLESPSGVTLAIDLGGDDEHGAKDADGCAGFGVAGIAVVVDARGADRYAARAGGQGAGFFGVGILVDLEGDDVYGADSNAQGAAACGLGILFDGAGKDSYRVGANGQGFGAVRGVGLLADGRGDDSYRSGGLVPDAGRDASRSVSMSQGFGFGYRFLDARLQLQGFVSGGIGALVDAEGNDAYESDVFGCGGAYFLALGLLVDGGGSDRYRAGRYGLGGAVHHAAALLLDLGGDDAYESDSTVTSGCGHDFACGLHVDLAGADRYETKTMSLGAANAAGAFGLLFNLGGDDRYRGDGSCLGKVVRGEYQPGMTPVSRALFVDCGGKDSYAGREGAADGKFWMDPDFPDLAAGADRGK